MDEARGERRFRRVEWALALLAFAALCLHQIDTFQRPFGIGKGTGERIAARWMAYGTREGAKLPLSEGAGLLVWERYPGAAAKPEFYGNHPPLAAWLARASWTVLPHGEGEWLSDEAAIRLPFLVCTLLTALLLAWISPTAVTVFALLRGSWFEGALPNFELPCLLFLTATVLLLAKGRRRSAMGVYPFALLADWTALFLLPALLLWQRRERRVLVGFLLMPLMAYGVSIAALVFATGSIEAAFHQLAAAVGKTGALAAGPASDELGGALLRHLELLCGLPMLGLAGLGLLVGLRTRAHEARLVALSLLSVAVLNVVVFREHALIHEAWLHYLLVPVALFMGTLSDRSVRPAWLRWTALLVVLGFAVHDAYQGRNARLEGLSRDPKIIAESLDDGFLASDVVLTTEDWSSAAFYARTFATRLVHQTPEGLEAWLAAHPNEGRRFLAIIPRPELAPLIRHCESRGFASYEVAPVRVFLLPR